MRGERRLYSPTFVPGPGVAEIASFIERQGGTRSLNLTKYPTSLRQDHPTPATAAPVLVTLAESHHFDERRWPAR